MARSKQENVPQTMRPLFEDIVRRTDAFCREYLNDEYAQLAREMAAALARKRPSPLTQGKVEGWACGIVYALGSINFLFDPSQTPHMTATELCERFGVSKSTAGSRSRKIQDLLNISMLDMVMSRSAPTAAGRRRSVSCHSWWASKVKFRWSSH